MLEKPNLPDSRIVDCLRTDYGLDAVRLSFLPLGADRDTAVYRAVTGDATPYFVKLRRGDFDETTVIVPRLLGDLGIRQIIAPLFTRSNRLWASLDPFRLTVSPYVDGLNGYEVELHDHHWVDFGRALKAVHTAVMPSTVIERIPRENYSAQWRERVRHFQALIDTTTFSDPVAAELAAFLRRQHRIVSELVSRAERLASFLQTRSLPFILCHADIHAGNILIDTSGQLYIVDWDTLILAPKERDLMYVGGGLFGGRRSPQEEEALFYQGYGQVAVDPVALAYYRYERIVQDIAAYCEQILLTDEGGADRQEGLRQLTGQFEPHAVIDVAFQSEARLPPEFRPQ
ncbi:MAG TPA: aminoglycoside phosphotransferase family protein [Spirillospora sp.]|nr:aminoglycoside phosphotransferase family protein [Spirillospora sp.]